MSIRHFLLVAVALTAAGGSQAATRVPGTPLADCVQLGDSHEAVRFAKQYLLIKDTDAYYRVSFNGDCEALGVSSQVNISTDRQPNRLCPAKTRVESARDVCNVRRVDRIDAAGYQHYQKRAR